MLGVTNGKGNTASSQWFVHSSSPVVFASSRCCSFSSFKVSGPAVNANPAPATLTPLPSPHLQPQNAPVAAESSAATSPDVPSTTRPCMDLMSFIQAAQSINASATSSATTTATGNNPRSTVGGSYSSRSQAHAAPNSAGVSTLAGLARGSRTEDKDASFHQAAGTSNTGLFHLDENSNLHSENSSWLPPDDWMNSISEDPIDYSTSAVDLRKPRNDSPQENASAVDEKTDEAPSVLTQRNELSGLTHTSTAVRSSELTNTFSKSFAERSNAESRTLAMPNLMEENKAFPLPNLAHNRNSSGSLTQRRNVSIQPFTLPGSSLQMQQSGRDPMTRPVGPASQAPGRALTSAEGTRERPINVSETSATPVLQGSSATVASDTATAKQQPAPELMVQQQLLLASVKRLSNHNSLRRTKFQFPIQQILGTLQNVRTALETVTDDPQVSSDSAKTMEYIASLLNMYEKHNEAATKGQENVSANVSMAATRAQPQHPSASNYATSKVPSATSGIPIQPAHTIRHGIPPATRQISLPALPSFSALKPILPKTAPPNVTVTDIGTSKPRPPMDPYFCLKPDVQSVIPGLRTTQSATKAIPNLQPATPNTELPAVITARAIQAAQALQSTINSPGVSNIQPGQSQQALTKSNLKDLQNLNLQLQLQVNRQIETQIGAASGSPDKKNTNPVQQSGPGEKPIVIKPVPDVPQSSAKEVKDSVQAQQAAAFLSQLANTGSPPEGSALLALQKQVKKQQMSSPIFLLPKDIASITSTSIVKTGFLVIPPQDSKPGAFSPQVTLSNIASPVSAGPSQKKPETGDKGKGLQPRHIDIDRQIAQVMGTLEKRQKEQTSATLVKEWLKSQMVAKPTTAADVQVAPAFVDLTSDFGDADGKHDEDMKIDEKSEPSQKSNDSRNASDTSNDNSELRPETQDKCETNGDSKKQNKSKNMEQPDATTTGTDYKSKDEAENRSQRQEHHTSRDLVDLAADLKKERPAVIPEPGTDVAADSPANNFHATKAENLNEESRSSTDTAVTEDSCAQVNSGDRRLRSRPVKRYLETDTWDFTESDEDDLTDATTTKKRKDEDDDENEAARAQQTRLATLRGHSQKNSGPADGGTEPAKHIKINISSDKKKHCPILLAKLSDPVDLPIARGKSKTDDGKTETYKEYDLRFKRKHSPLPGQTSASPKPAEKNQIDGVSGRKRKGPPAHAQSPKTLRKFFKGAAESDDEASTENETKSEETEGNKNDDHKKDCDDVDKATDKGSERNKAKLVDGGAKPDGGELKMIITRSGTECRSRLKTPETLPADDKRAADKDTATALVKDSTGTEEKTHAPKAHSTHTKAGESRFPTRTPVDLRWDGGVANTNLEDQFQYQSSARVFWNVGSQGAQVSCPWIHWKGSCWKATSLQTQSCPLDLCFSFCWCGRGALHL